MKKDFHPENLRHGVVYQLLFLGTDRQIHEEVGRFIKEEVWDGKYHVWFDMDCGIRTSFILAELIKAIPI